MLPCVARLWNCCELRPRRIPRILRLQLNWHSFTTGWVSLLKRFRSMSAWWPEILRTLRRALILGPFTRKAIVCPKPLRCGNAHWRPTPALTDARLNLAVAQIRQGDREAGIASLHLARNLDPDNVAVAQLLLRAR